MRIGLLDLCVVAPGYSPATALHDTVQLAIRADELGFSRFWIAEHHGRDSAHSSPELLVPIIAGLTNSIRVGTGGILLHLQSPLKVAKNFRVLEALFPGRIDLGVGAGRADDETMRRLRDGQLPGDDYVTRLMDLIDYLRNDSSIPVMPTDVGVPEVWVLGTGGSRSMEAAGLRRVSYGLSLFHATSRDDPAALRRYRDQFTFGPNDSVPRWNVTVAGVCSDSQRDVARLMERHTNGFIKPTVSGTAQQCVEQLQQIAQRYDTNEIMFCELAQEPALRIRSCELIAETAHLAARP